MHVARKVHVGRNGFAHMRNPLHHAVNLAVAGSPVDLVEARRIGGVVKINLHRRKSLSLDPRQLPVRLFPNRHVHVRVAIDANLLAEFPAQKLVDRQFQRFAGKIPQRDFKT